MLQHSRFQHSRFPRRGGSASPPPPRKAPPFPRLVSAVTLQRHSPPPLNAGGGGSGPVANGTSFRALALEALAGRGLLASVLCAVLMKERSVEYLYLYLDVDIYLEWVAVAIASRPGARGHGAS